MGGYVWNYCMFEMTKVQNQKHMQLHYTACYGLPVMFQSSNSFPTKV